MRYRLRKGVNELSSGTIVEIVDADEPTSDEVVWVVPSGQWDNDYVEVPMNCLEPYNERSDIIPANTRRERREGLERKTLPVHATGENVQVPNS